MTKSAGRAIRQPFFRSKKIDRGTPKTPRSWKASFLTENGRRQNPFLPLEKSQGGSRSVPLSIVWDWCPPKRHFDAIFADGPKIEWVVESWSGTTKYVILFAYNTFLAISEKVGKSIPEGMPKGMFFGAGTAPTSPVGD